MSNKQIKEQSKVRENYGSLMNKDSIKSPKWLFLIFFTDYDSQIKDPTVEKVQQIVCHCLLFTNN